MAAKTDKQEKDEHMAAFNRWLHSQGDLSAKSMHEVVRSAFFSGADYGLELTKKILRETPQE